MRRQGVFLVILGVLLVASILTFAVVFQLLREDVGQVPVGQSLLSVREGAGGGLSFGSFSFWSVLLSPILAGATLFFLLRRNRSWRSRSHIMGLLSFIALLVMVFGMINPKFISGSQGEPSPDRPASEKMSSLLKLMQDPLARLLKSISDTGALADALKNLSSQIDRVNKQLESGGLDKLDARGLAEAFKELSNALKEDPEALKDLDPDALRDLLISLDSLGEQGLLDQMKEREDLVQALEQALLVSRDGVPPELAALLAGLGAGAALESGVQVTPEGLNAGTSLSPEGGHSAPEVPLFKVRGAKYTGYLRQNVADKYDGKTWQDGQRPALFTYASQPLATVPEGASFQAEVEIEMEPLVPFTSDNLLTSLYPDTIDFQGPVYYNPSELTFHSSGGLGDGYSWRSIVLSYDPNALRKAGVSDQSRYLQLPAVISQEIRDLAAEVTRGIANPYDKAIAIRDYLKATYTYDFDYQNAPSDVEPTYWFLFREKRGTCANFANAFVIMARSVGIPARPVSGFAISATADEQVVMAGQAHQWAEVLFNDIGWVTFEATPSAGPSGRVPESTDPVPDPTPAPTPTPMPTPTPTPPPPASLFVHTVTEITELGDTALKGEPFTVYGTVMTADGQTVERMDVDIYLNAVKAHGGMLIGRGEATGGSFAIEAVVPPDIPVGSYQVLAHAIANGIYRESWSDPPLVVAAETVIEVQESLPAPIGGQAVISGYLREAQSKSPLRGQTLSLIGPRGSLASARTNEEGYAEFRVTSSERGLTVYAIRFEGTQFYGPSEEQAVVAFQEPTEIACQFPETMSLGERDTAMCALTDGDGNPVSGHSVVVGFGIVQVFSYPLEDIQPTSKTPVVIGGGGDVFAVLTDGNGEITFGIAPARAGNLPFFAYGTALDFYASDLSEAIIPVSSSTSMKLDTLDRAIVGQRYPVSGIVLDALGNLVSTGNVLLTTPSSTLGEATVDESGLFSLPYTFTDRDTFTINAVYTGPSYYDDTSASASLGVASPTQVSLTLPQQVGVREQVLIGGMLTDDTGAGLGGHGLRLQIGPARDAQTFVLTTDALGRFSMPYAFSETGTYGVSAIFDGSGLLMAASASATLDVLEAVIEPMAEPVLVRGASNSITGRFLLGGSPIEGISVDALVDGDPVGSSRTDAGGRFEIEYTPPVTTALGAHELEYRAPRYDLSLSIEAQLRMLTHLSVYASEEVRAGGSLKMSAVLVDDLNNPRMGEVVMVEGSNAKGETDYRGIAEIKVGFPRDAATGPVTLTVVYPGRDRLIGADAEYTVLVLPSTVPWMLIGYVAGGSVGGVALAGALGYVGYRRSDKLRQLLGQLRSALFGLLERIARWLHLPEIRLPVASSDGVRMPLLTWVSAMWAWLLGLFRRAGEPAREVLGTAAELSNGAEAQGASAAASQARPRLAGRNGRRTRMERPEFPQIQTPFPDVWGVGYPFEVRSRLLADDGNGIAGATLVCRVNGTVIQRSDTDAEGRATFRLRFDMPKEYSLHILFEGDEEFRSSSAERGLCAVDYREEVVGLYHAVLDMARRAGRAVPKDATPREAQAVLRDAGIDQDALESITRCFEEADYSTHEIARKHYEEAYLAHLRLAQSFGEARAQ